MSDRICPGILVVDDQPDLRALLQTILRHYGFRVVLAASGREAVPIYRVKHDDLALVLLNVAMSDSLRDQLLKSGLVQKLKSEAKPAQKPAPASNKAAGKHFPRPPSKPQQAGQPHPATKPPQAARPAG